MSRLRLIRGMLLAATIVTVSGRAAAFDSAGPEIGFRTYNPRPPDPAWPFGVNFQFDSTTAPATVDSLYGFGSRNVYRLRTVRQAFGDPYGNTPDSLAVSNVLKCQRTAIVTSPAGPPQLDLSKCASAPALLGGHPYGEVGWVKAHRSWSVEPSLEVDVKNGHTPEHLLIALEALSLAGMGTWRLFREPFYVRYPVRDGFIASPTDHPDSLGTISTGDLVVAQSLKPVGFDDVESLATRAVFLPALAQMPDAASSVWDWAGGMEECPFSGVSGPGASVFGGFATGPDGKTKPVSIYDVNACHSFTRMMGVLNATHFLPASKQVYRHYHQLALATMDRCKALAPLAEPFHEQELNGAKRADWPLSHSTVDSEAQECEREAFVYEMFAQHFLQDAWSTGHMWQRWGYATLGEFPGVLGPSPYTTGTPGKPPTPMGLTDYAPANPLEIGPRKFVTGGVVAVFSGMIHGSKAVSVSASRDLNGDTTTDFFDAHGIMDDPLCGPQYVIYGGVHATSFVYGGAPPGSGVFPGSGDLFWRGSTNSVLDDPNRSEQKLRLLGCSAVSLREVYNAGPQLEGKLPALPGVDESSADFNPRTGEKCWDHYATNGSMLGAVYPMPFDVDPRTMKDENLRRFVMARINKILVGRYAGAVVFPDEDDRAAFLAAVSDRFPIDQLRTELYFATNAFLNPEGSENAKFVGAPLDLGPMGGTLPNHAAVPDAASIPYYDQSAAHPYVSRMFWRSHLKDVCLDAVTPNPDNGMMLVEDLRDRCVRGAEQGGDPDACTACVDVAEALIPQCDVGTGVGKSLGSSKCELLGVPMPTTKLPALWFDGDARRAATDAIACGKPSYWLAVHYCTGTSQPRDSSKASIAVSMTTVQQLSSTIIGASACTTTDPFGNPVTRNLTREQMRVATVLSELPAKYAEVPLSEIHSGPGPIVVAYHATVDNLEEPDTCRPYQKEYVDQLLDAGGLHGFPLYSDGVGTLFGHPQNQYFIGDKYNAAVPTCGLQQKFSFWNQECSAVAAVIALPPTSKTPTLDAIYDDITGSQRMTSTTTGESGYAPEQRCSLRHPREFVSACPSAAATLAGTSPRVCAASGACVAQTRYRHGGFASHHPELMTLDVVSAGP